MGEASTLGGFPVRLLPAVRVEDTAPAGRRADLVTSHRSPKDRPSKTRSRLRSRRDGLREVWNCGEQSLLGH